MTKTPTTKYPMKRKQQNSSKNLAKRQNSGTSKAQNVGAALLPISIAQVDTTTAEIALVDGAEATKIARPSLHVCQDKTTGLVLYVSTQQLRRKELARIVERLFAREQSRINWVDGKK